MTTKKHRIYTMSLAGVHPHYVTKAEKKGRTRAEVDEIIRWLTGYSQEQLEVALAGQAHRRTRPREDDGEDPTGVRVRFPVAPGGPVVLGPSLAVWAESPKASFDDQAS